MNTKKLTESAMLSAVFVVLSIVAISTGLAYSIYLDIIVPIFISLVYLRLGFRYTLLSSITSLLIVMLAIGDVVSGIWMSQGILLGFVCGYFISQESTIFDDIFKSTIIGCFIMIFIDIYFSKITGYSFIQDIQGYSSMFGVSSEVFKSILYIMIASIPLSSVFIVYFVALITGKKLNILNSYSNEKLIIIKNYKKLGGYICCSEKSYISAVIFLVIIEIFRLKGINSNFIYLETVLMSIRVVAIYFVLKDSFTFTMKWMYSKVKSRGIAQLMWLFTLYMLLVNFKVTFIILIAVSLSINIFLHMRVEQITMLNKYLRMKYNK